MSTKAIIAGGSLGGLMTGIVMKAIGVDAHIYERSPKVLDDRGAGIVMQAETETFLTQYAGLSPEQTGVRLKYRQYLNRQGTPDIYQEMPQVMTSWGLIYRALRGAFLNANYHEGASLNGFSQSDHGVAATFEGACELTADILVGADGSRSFVRQKLMPDVKPHYAGYVAWRGVVPESSASELLTKTFVDHFTFQQMERSHILCYLIPGPEGETEPGKRRINWVWYWNVPEAELPKLMTGVDGHERDFSVPPGQVREECLKKQDAIAGRVFCPQFLELWRSTETPFLQPILDLAVPRMVQGRVLLLGDAAFIPRPHTAASTAKAGANALALGRALREFPDEIDAALKEWETDQLALGRGLERSGRGLGNRSQFPLSQNFYFMNTMKIEIYSDLICPWCYIGKRRMQAGLKLLGKEFNPKIVWRPFQLNPDMPIEGMNRKTYRTKKFGSWGRSLAMDAEVAATGKSLGIDFNYAKVLVTPNTLAGHRLLWWAEQQNHQDHLAEALFRAYYIEGRDVGRRDVLAEIAVEVGLPQAEALLFLDSDAGKKEVEGAALKGMKLGLQGVPFFVVNDVPAFSGAQMPHAFLQVFQQALGQDGQECVRQQH